MIELVGGNFSYLFLRYACKQLFSFCAFRYSDSRRKIGSKLVVNSHIDIVTDNLVGDIPQNTRA